MKVLVGIVMGSLITCASPFSLDDLAARVRKSSNFRFNWQFFRTDGIAPQSPLEVRNALEAIIANPDLHRFLEQSFQAMYAKAFEIESLHEHCQIVPAENEFENILASAAGDHLGAYSGEMRSAKPGETQGIKDLFGAFGNYSSFQLLPGNVPDCSTCRVYNSHLFSTWYYGVAWDWCLFASWPNRKLFWMGCLTDTD
jgi:hypothetical protein